MGGAVYVPRFGTPGFDHGRLRASDADRERTIDVLKAAFAEGRLTKDEYDERLDMVYRSRTYAELAALTADLPVGPHPAPLPATAGAHMAVPAQRQTNPLAITSLVLGLAEPFTCFLTAIPAIICGHTARRQIRRTGESGEGLATAGLVFGWLGAIFLALILVSIVMFVAMPGGGPGGP